MYAVSAVLVVGIWYIESERLEATKDGLRKQENMQNVANAKSETRAKMQGKLQDQINARNIRKTQAQVASAVTYERLLADRSRRETAKMRQNHIESQTTGHRYSRGNPV